MAREQVIAEIVRLLEQADDKALRFILAFLRG